MSSDVHSKLSKRNSMAGSSSNLDSIDQDFSDLRVEYFEHKDSINLNSRKDEDEFQNLPIYSTQQGRIVTRKARASSSKKNITQVNTDRQKATQAQSQMEWMKKVYGDKQISQLKKQQKRERMIFEAVSQNFNEKENEQIVSCKELMSENNDELKIKKVNKSNVSLLEPISNHFANGENENQQHQNIDDISPIHTENNKVEDMRNFKFDNHINSYETPLLTQKKVIRRGSQTNKKSIQDPQIKNSQSNSYQVSLNKVSQVYNIPINSVNQSLAKNKKKNQLLIKMTPNEIQRPSSGNTGNSNTIESYASTEVSQNNNTVSPMIKATITPKKQVEPIKVIRKLPSSSSSNLIVPQSKQNQQTSASAQKYDRSNPYGVQQNIGSGSNQRMPQIKTKSNSIPINSAYANPQNQNTATSLIKLLQKDKLSTIDSANKKSGNKNVSQRLAHNQQSQNLNHNILQISTDQINQTDGDISQQNFNDLGDKYNNGNNKIIFSNNNLMQEETSMKFDSQNNIEEETEDISSIDIQEIISTNSSNTITMITNQQQVNFTKKKGDDKSLNIQNQFYGTIREDENEDFDQTPMQGNNIFKRIDQSKREQLDKEIREETLEDSQSNVQELPQFKRNCNSQDSTPINIQQNINHRWNRSRFQRISPNNSPNKSKRGKSVQCEATSNDQSFSAQNGVFEESVSIDSSMSSEFQFQGLNHSHHHPNSQNKEQNSQILSQNILDELDNEEQKIELDELKQSKLTRQNLDKLVSQSQILKQNQEIQEKQLDYLHMNQEEKIAEINKIKKQIDDEKKKNDQEKQKLLLKQMELERQRLLYKQQQEKINKEKESLVILKGDYEKIKIQKQKGSSCQPSDKSEEQSLQQYLIYLSKKQDKIERDIEQKENNIFYLDKNITETSQIEKILMNEIEFLKSVQNYNQIEPIQDQNNQQLQSTNIFLKKPQFRRQSNLIAEQKVIKEDIVSLGTKPDTNSCQIIVSANQIQFPNSQIANSQGIISIDSNNILKEGWLYKKTPSIFRGWKDIDGDRFSITIEGYKRKFELKSNAKFTSQEWVNLINIVIEENSQLNKPMINTLRLNQYFKNDLMTEQEFLSTVESGDILLFETNNVSAKFQRRLTGSKYVSIFKNKDHVALCIKMENKDIRIFDSTSDEGVALSEWDEYIYVNDLYEKVTLRKLEGVDKAKIEQAVLNFILENIGKKYAFNFKKLIRYCPKSYRDTQGREKDPNTYFCSELVAKFFKNVDLLPQDKPASSYWPISFSQIKNMELLKGASFGNEITIVLDRHRNLFKERKQAKEYDSIPKK